MTIGHVIRNSLSAVQIDTSYQNLELATSGTALCTELWFPLGSSPSGGWYASAIISIAANGCPLTALVPGVRAYIQPVGYNGATYSFRVVANSNNASVRYFVYDAPASDPGGIALRLRNPVTGKTVYNSLRRYMRVIDNVSGNDATSLSISKSYTVPIAVVQGGLALRYLTNTTTDPITGDVRFYNRMDAAVLGGSSTSVTLQYIGTLFEGPVPNQRFGADYGQLGFCYLVLDMTGLI